MHLGREDAAEGEIGFEPVSSSSVGERHRRESLASIDGEVIGQRRLGQEMLGLHPERVRHRLPDDALRQAPSTDEILRYFGTCAATSPPVIALHTDAF
jgi:hypothetical protein